MIGGKINCHDNACKINRQHIYKSSRSTTTHNHAHKGNDEERTQDIEGQVFSHHEIILISYLFIYRYLLASIDWISMAGNSEGVHHV
eukprot:COSAG01_NODE_5497_length_4224_cov_7.503273_5_plen_87_part_00